MTEYSRIVVRAPNWLGDAVMALPAIAAIRRRYASAHLAVAAPANLQPFFEMVEGIDQTIGMAHGGTVTAVRQLKEDARRVAAARFDLAVLLPNSFSSALVMSMAGVPERWGYRTDWRAPLLTQTFRQPRRTNGVVHQAQYYLDLVNALGIPTDSGGWLPVRTSAEAEERVSEMLRAASCPESGPFVGIAPGAAYGHAKRWPPDRFAGVIVHLLNRGFHCVLVGSRGDADSGVAIESSVAKLRAETIETSQGRLVNFIGRTDLSQLLALIGRCRAFVSNDSGAMHLASALGIPVTAVFGSTDERATAPLGPARIVTHPVWCRPCLLRECPIDHRCMTGIGVDAVYEAVQSQLQQVEQDRQLQPAGQDRPS